MQQKSYTQIWYVGVCGWHLDPYRPRGEWYLLALVYVNSLSFSVGVHTWSIPSELNLIQNCCVVPYFYPERKLEK